VAADLAAPHRRRVNRLPRGDDGGAPRAAGRDPPAQPSTLDAATLEGMVALYTGPRQQAVLEHYVAQARCWEAQARPPAQRRAALRLVNARERLGAEIAAVLALADDMEGERHEAADRRSSSVRPSSLIRPPSVLLRRGTLLRPVTSDRHLPRVG